MAQRLKDYTPARKPGPSPKYPWDKWLNGAYWRLFPGKDFSCSPDSLSDMIRQRAKDRGLSVSVYRESVSLVVVASSLKKPTLKTRRPLKDIARRFNLVDPKHPRKKRGNK